MDSKLALRRELMDTRKGMRPLVEKLARGERLSFEERASLNKQIARADEIDGRILELDERDAAVAEGNEWSATYDNASTASNGAEERAMVEYLKTGRASVELRAAGEATGSAGGFLVPPAWWQRLQVALKSFGGTELDFAPLPTETGATMTWATNNPTGVVGTLLAENTQVPTQDYTFGQGTLGAYMITSGVQLVSFQLDTDSAFDTGAFIASRVGEALGRARAAYAMTGNGTSAPMGIVTALNAFGGSNGSGGTVSLTAATKLNTVGPGSGSAAYQQATELVSGAIAPQTVAKLIGSVDRAYRSLGAKFYMSDATLQAMRCVSDAYGRPLYTELLDDTVPKLRGYDVTVDNNVPALTASTASGVIFGHLPSAMVMRTVAPNGGPSVGLLRLSERYADFLQVGYIGYQRVDMKANDLRAAAVIVPAAT